MLDLLPRRWSRTVGRLSRLNSSRPDKPLPLNSEHVSGAQLFASRQDYIASLPNGAICAEVGVQHGNFSAYILETAKPDKLHLIDRSLSQFNVKERFAGQPNVVFHEGQSADILRSFPDAYFDWVYIDAGHRYKAVRADATIAARKTKPSGLLIFNDYIIWSHLEGFEYGVVRTVNEMCTNERWQMVAFCLSQEMYCDVALARV